MSSNTISPSIDQAALLNFNDSYHELAQQKNTRLGSSKAVKYLDSSGKTNNMARIGRIELDEVNVRNPDKQYGDYALDNRQFNKRRFTKTIQIDKLYDINELLKDPTSDILKQLVNAKNRVIDRVIVSAAVGSVEVGAPNAATTTVSAATDGVLTVDASAGLTYEKVQEITENFINNDIPYEDFMGTCFAVTGKENTQLMGEIEFIHNDYITSIVASGQVAQQVGTFEVVPFAGSKNGGITVNNPIIPEGATLRTCPVLAPDAVAVSMEIGSLEVTPAYNKVNSMDITIDLWINAMRTEGVLVQILSTTI